MNTLLSSPLFVFTTSFIAMWLAAHAGTFVRDNLRPLQEDQRDDFAVVQAASLTLLGLLIGFTFSMAISRYDLRKNYEEAEANAIGTEYVRADFLPAPDAARVRTLLRSYIDQRVLFYTNRDEGTLSPIDASTAQLQSEMWSAVKSAASAQPTPPMALVVSGMNDVLNSQGYTQAAWWNRIPLAAWTLVTLIAVCCNLLIGFGARRTSVFLFIVVPLAASISFALIADIDSPRGGSIRVVPQDLLSLSQSLRGQ